MKGDKFNKIIPRDLGLVRKPYDAKAHAHRNSVFFETTNDTFTGEIVQTPKAEIRFAVNIFEAFAKNEDVAPLLDLTPDQQGKEVIILGVLVYLSRVTEIPLADLKERKESIINLAKAFLQLQKFPAPTKF